MNYIPQYKLNSQDYISWTTIDTKGNYKKLLLSGHILWCNDNIKGKWTILNFNTIAFEYGEDALIYKINFLE